MSLYDQVDREALHDWLNQRQALAADERPDVSEIEDRLDEKRADYEEDER
jgi:Fe-S cluster biosynthesis and repair protein YggX